MICVEDDLGRAVRLATPAHRIVSLVPSVTETLFTLGCGDAVVGVTRYCTEPAAGVAHVERVGGTKNPDVARIGTLAPDIVLVSAEENRREDFEALESLGLTVFVLLPVRASDCAGLLRRIGQLTGTSACAESLAAALERRLASLPIAGRVPRRVFCPIWKNPWMSFNRQTYAHDMLANARGENVCAGYPERYCTVTLDTIAAAMPEVILLPDEPYVFTAKALPALAPLHDTPAWRAGRVHFIDGKALSWYGPRTAAALAYLQSYLEAIP